MILSHIYLPFWGWGGGGRSFICCIILLIKFTITIFCMFHLEQSYKFKNAIVLSLLFYVHTTFIVLKSNRARIFKQPMGARNRVGRGLSYRSARLHRRAELIPRKSILALLKSLKIRAQLAQCSKTTL